MINRFNAKMMVMLSFLFIFKMNIFGIYVLEKVELDKKDVTLADIIITQDESILKKASNKNLGKINIPGGKLIINRMSLIRHLNSIGISKKKLPEKVIIKRTFIYMAKDEIEKKLIELHKEKLINEGYEVLVSINGRDSIKMPSGETTFGIDYENLTQGRYWKRLRVIKNNETVYEVPYLLIIGYVKKKITLLKDVKKGESVIVSDLKIEKINDNSVVNSGNIDFSKPIVYLKDIKGGTVINSSMVAEQKLIMKGDKITLSLISGSVSIKDVGVSLEDGNLDDEILVKNLRSGKELKGKIKDKNSVEIKF